MASGVFRRPVPPVSTAPLTPAQLDVLQWLSVFGPAYVVGRSRRTAEALQRRGLAVRSSTGKWRLTQRGLDLAVEGA